MAHKQELASTKAEVARLTKLGKENPLALAEELSGMTFHELMTKASKGEFDKPQHATLPPEIQAQIDRLAQFEKAETERQASEKTAREAKAAEDKAAADRVADRAHVSSLLQGKAEELPFCASLDFVADRIVDEAYAEIKAGRKPDPAAIAKHMESEAKDFIRGLMMNTQAMALLASDKEVRDSLSKAFGGLSEQKKSPVSDPRTTAPKQPARTLPNSHEIPARINSGGFASPEEERAESVRLLRRLIDGQSI